ncbi:hypothetical protein J4Q44_G00189270 [Coregonus suidteri]|uniref:Uncharacterized protein n=1 Tax=Coregonus suidteri TaxID=861788 RepID=A0AAN8LLZ9_9TELE
MAQGGFQVNYCAFSILFIIDLDFLYLEIKTFFFLYYMIVFTNRSWVGLIVVSQIIKDASCLFHNRMQTEHLNNTKGKSTTFDKNIHIQNNF